MSNILGRISNAARTAADRGSELIEVQKTNLRISESKGKLTALYAQIGERVYGAYASNPEAAAYDAETMQLFGEIQGEMAQIAELENELQKLKPQAATPAATAPAAAAAEATEATAGSITCPGCSTVNAAGTRFCSSCGTKLFLVCPVCGVELALGTRFCGACGASMGGGE